MIEKEQPIEEKMRQVMNDIGHVIGREIKKSGERYGFALLVFPMGENEPHDRMNYISNARREDMLAAMKEFIARVEGRYDDGDFTRKKA
jgi:hypothetical protein